MPREISRVLTHLPAKPQDSDKPQSWENHSQDAKSLYLLNFSVNLDQDPKVSIRVRSN